MKQFRLSDALFMSFYSSELYRDIGRNWHGIGLLYLFTLLLVASIPSVVKLQLSVSEWVDRDAPETVGKIPRITITNGEVSTNVETPYYIPNPKSRATRLDEKSEYLAVIDLTGKYKSLQDVSASILLTKKAASVRQSGSEIRTYDLSHVQSVWLDSARVTGWLQTAKYVLAPAFYVLILLFSFVYRTAQVAIYAAIGLLFVKWKRAGLRYPDLMRLSAVAVTPPLVFNELVDLFRLHPPAWSWICFGIAMGYLRYAVNANATLETGPTLHPMGAAPGM